MSRTLITGGTGFVGPHLAAFLKTRTSRLAVLASCGCGETIPEAVCYEADVRDAGEVRAAIHDFRPDRVYHLAAISSVEVSWSRPRLTYEVNVDGTLNVLEAAMTLAQPPRVLNVSTAQVYAPSSSPLSEDSALGPDNPYAASKAMAELLGVLYRKIPAGGIITARSFNHAGPGQSSDFVLSSIARQFAEIEAGMHDPELSLGNIHVRRDFTDVRDVVRAYWHLLEDGAVNQTYNVCSGRSWAIHEIILQFESISGIKVSVGTHPDKVRGGEMSEVRGNPDKIYKATGWEPQIPLETTVRDLLDYWRSTLRNSDCMRNITSAEGSEKFVPSMPLRST